MAPTYDGIYPDFTGEVYAGTGELQQNDSDAFKLGIVGFSVAVVILPLPVRDIPMVPQVPAEPEEVGRAIPSRPDMAAEENPEDRHTDQVESGESASSQANGDLGACSSIWSNPSFSTLASTRMPTENPTSEGHIAEGQRGMETARYPRIDRTSVAFARFETRMKELSEEAVVEGKPTDTITGDRNTPYLDEI
ncbi:hypothetical protein NX059_006187 [Plenodomus lindquistii]|nr:hypothetical protein NX059_006187 [Plenodomus lindquistii]